MLSKQGLGLAFALLFIALPQPGSRGRYADRKERHDTLIKSLLSRAVLLIGRLAVWPKPNDGSPSVAGCRVDLQ